MINNQQSVPVIKADKIDGGYHGGAWKVAYADFVTAMMAFFLLLWLLNVTTDEQKFGIADYFSPNVASLSTSGAGGVLGGEVITKAQENRNNNNSAMIQTELPPAGMNPDGERVNNSELDGGVTADVNALDKASEADEQKAKLAAMQAAKEEAELKEAEAEIKQAVLNDPELSDLGDNLMLDMTPEGLRVQLTDNDKYSMFPPGSARMQTKTRKLLHKISKVAQRLPNKLAISGHTDGYTFATGPGYTNWELSADRANASRRAMLEQGLSEKRIERILGKADKEHLFPDAYDPRNRRISIILLKEFVIDGFDHRKGKSLAPKEPAPTLQDLQGQ